MGNGKGGGGWAEVRISHVGFARHCTSRPPFLTASSPSSFLPPFSHFPSPSASIHRTNPSIYRAATQGQDTAMQSTHYTWENRGRFDRGGEGEYCNLPPPFFAVVVLTSVIPYYFFCRFIFCISPIGTLTLFVCACSPVLVVARLNLD